MSFLQGLRFPPVPETCTCGDLACPHCPHPSGCGQVWEALGWKGVLSAVGPAWHPELPGWAPATAALTWESALETRYLTFLIHLSSMDVELTFPSVFNSRRVRGLYLEVW